jgi:hypothetical protein
MRIIWTEEMNLSDREVEILKYLDQAEHNMYIWYANDHFPKDPFIEHEVDRLIRNGFISRGSDYNFGDRYVHLNDKGRRLVELVKGSDKN